MRRILLTLIVLMPTICFGQYSALIVTGQSNHNWKVASAIPEGIFNESRLFSGNVNITPEQGQDISSLNGIKELIDSRIS